MGVLRDQITVPMLQANEKKERDSNMGTCFFSERQNQRDFMDKRKKTVPKIKEYRLFSKSSRLLARALQSWCRTGMPSFPMIQSCHTTALHTIRPCLRRGNHNRLAISFSYKTHVQVHRMTQIFITISSNRNVECENHEL